MISADYDRVNRHVIPATATIPPIDACLAGHDLWRLTTLAVTVVAANGSLTTRMSRTRGTVGQRDGEEHQCRAAIEFGGGSDSSAVSMREAARRQRGVHRSVCHVSTVNAREVRKVCSQVSMRRMVSQGDAWQ